MEIESYLVESAEELIANPDELKEYTELVEKLELTGQQELIGQGGTPIPFQAMDVSTKRVLETLFPEKKSVSLYRGEMIPLRVLSLIALAKQENYFDLIQIWYKPNTDDPVAVGIKGSQWSGEYYLIARWGKALLPMEQLTNMAAEVKKNELELNARNRIRELQAIVDEPHLYARQYLNGEGVHI